MTDTKLDPRSLTSEERILLDAFVLMGLRCEGPTLDPNCYPLSLVALTPLILARRAIFGEPASGGGKVRMTEELEAVLQAATFYAADFHTPVATAQRMERSIAAVRAQAAEAGKVTLPKVRSYFLSLSMLPEYRNDQGRAFLAEVKAELDAAEGGN